MAAFGETAGLGREVTHPSVPESAAILSNPDEVLPRVRQLKGVLALDTEFHAEARYRPELMWIQIADEEGCCAVVDAQVAGCTVALCQALENRDLLVHAGMHDLRILSQHAQVRPRSVFDTQIAAGLLGLRYPMSLSRLVEALLGVNLPSSEAMSDWSQRPMSTEQLAYACADVSFLHPLREKLAALPQLAQLPPLEECCESILEEALQETPDSELWRRFHAAATLDPQGREILRRACIVRRDIAREKNRGERQIYSDSSLIDLAKRKPRSLESLNQPRNIPRKLKGELGLFLVDCVNKALLVPPRDCPPPLKSGPGEPECQLLLQAWSEYCFRTLGLSPRLLLPEPLRQQLAESWSEGQELLFQSKWRKMAAGEQLSKLAAGQYRLGQFGLETA